MTLQALAEKLIFLFQVSFLLLSLFTVAGVSSECQIPLIIRGAWFSWENGKSTLTEINAEEMTRRYVESIM